MKTLKNFAKPYWNGALQLIGLFTTLLGILLVVLITIVFIVPVTMVESKKGERLAFMRKTLTNDMFPTVKEMWKLFIDYVNK